MKKRMVLTTVVFSIMLSAAAQDGQPLQEIRLADNQRYFVQADGTPFFWLGDTAWSIFNQASPDQVDQYLADRAEKGFNVVQGCVVLWNGLRRTNPDGELPFVGGDPSQINEAYFENVDTIIEKAERHGLYMAILPVWIKGYIRNPERYGDTLLNPEKMRAYCKFLGQRYGDRPIFWMLGGDWPGRDTGELSDAMAAGLIEGAGTEDILITYHPTGRQSSSFWFHDSDWLDFNIIQSGHFIETTNFQLVADDYARTSVKPTLDSEPAYENITDRLIRDDPNARRIQAEDVRRSAYLAVFAGAAGHTYGCGEVYEFWGGGRPLPGWAAQLPFEESLDLPGASHMQFLRRLIESRPMLERIPDQSLILSENSDRATRRVQACRASDGAYAFIYMPGNQSVEVDLSKLSGDRLSAHWYDTRSGEAARIGDFDRAASREFTPPDANAAGWVLVLDDASRQFSPPGEISAENLP